MKHASSLNALNVGGEAAEDHSQVRSLPCPARAAQRWAVLPMQQGCGSDGQPHWPALPARHVGCVSQGCSREHPWRVVGLVTLKTA